VIVALSGAFPKRRPQSGVGACSRSCSPRSAIHSAFATGDSSLGHTARSARCPAHPPHTLLPSGAPRGPRVRPGIPPPPGNAPRRPDGPRCRAERGHTRDRATTRPRPPGAARRCVRCSRKRSRGACGLRPVPARRAARGYLRTFAELNARSVMAHAPPPFRTLQC